MPCPVTMRCVGSQARAGRREMEPGLSGPWSAAATGSREQRYRRRRCVLLLMSHEMEPCFDGLHGDVLCLIVAER